MIYLIKIILLDCNNQKQLSVKRYRRNQKLDLQSLPDKCKHLFYIRRRQRILHSTIAHGKLLSLNNIMNFSA